MTKKKQQTWFYNFNTKYLYMPSGNPVMTASTDRYAIFSNLEDARWWVKHKGPKRWRKFPVDEMETWTGTAECGE